MSKKKQLEPITLTSELPENGAYPPRFLTTAGSTWLFGDEELSFGKFGTLKKVRSNWILVPRSGNKLLINGRPVLYDYQLKDGDFIQFEGERMIFQADPVADYRQFMLESDRTIEVNPSASLRKWVRVDHDGLSLDGGKNTAKWHEIVSINVQSTAGFRSTQWEVQITANQKGKARKLPCGLRAIYSQDMVDLIMLVFYHAPFHLSTNDQNRNIWIDAYAYAAHTKLLIPADYDEAALPTSPERILGMFTKVDRRITFWMVIGALLVLSVIESKVTDLSFHSIVKIAIFFVFIGLFLLAWFSFMASPVFLSPLIRRYIKRIKQKLFKSTDSDQQSS